MGDIMAKTVGAWAFLVGVVLAIVLGAVGSISGLLAISLVILGIIIGLLNITEKETQPFLMAGVVLVIVSALGQTVLSVIPVIARMLSALLILFVPATVIVAVKSVFALAKD
ncbi:MAG: hypothetical protein QF632_03135 [Candidatus Woesearchaeota archaeon]|jgi:uncharacterized membrane protein|nr:hypothetical protein [Candidatus Woesearchaeota archaeon]MDP7457840.1 hypothetical protein [Candidatus Woesearchaeota archaeon]|tara:strand:- start:303 stop:638 length:336 start_codon:yes stop_codon:yes gene_type:complete